MANLFQYTYQEIPTAEKLTTTLWLDQGWNIESVNNIWNMKRAIKNNGIILLHVLGVNVKIVVICDNVDN